MRVLALDIEMNKDSFKCIQVGAICFQPDNGIIIDQFNHYVNPKEPIDPYITTLTGITDDLVKGEANIEHVSSELTKFKERLSINPIVVVWGAGLSNDVRKIYEEAGVENPFSNRIIDVKAIFQMYANASNGKLRQKMGLAKACDRLGLGWDYSKGWPHNALADAYHTMRVYMFLSRCLKGAVDIKLG